MIKCNIYTDSNTQEKRLGIVLSDTSIDEFYILLNRALNTNPEMQKLKEWLSLSDSIEETFIHPQLGRIPS